MSMSSLCSTQNTERPRRNCVSLYRICAPSSTLSPSVPAPSHHVCPFYHLSNTAQEFYNFTLCSDSSTPLQFKTSQLKAANPDDIPILCRHSVKRTLLHIIHEAFATGSLNTCIAHLVKHDVEQFQISQEDERVFLRGQWGLRSRRYIPCGELCMPIQMWLGTESEYHAMMSPSETCHAAMYDSDILTPTHKHDVLIGTMYKPFGNLTALINDFRNLNNLPHCGKTIAYFDSTQEPYLHKINVAMVEVTLKGFPYLFFINTRDIACNEELLADYGSLYWTTLHTLSLQRATTLQ